MTRTMLKVNLIWDSAIWLPVDLINEFMSYSSSYIRFSSIMKCTIFILDMPWNTQLDVKCDIMLLCIWHDTNQTFINTYNSREPTWTSIGPFDSCKSSYKSLACTCQLVVNDCFVQTCKKCIRLKWWRSFFQNMIIFVNQLDSSFVSVKGTNL